MGSVTYIFVYKNLYPNVPKFNLSKDIGLEGQREKCIISIFVNLIMPCLAMILLQKASNVGWIKVEIG